MARHTIGRGKLLSSLAAISLSVVLCWQALARVARGQDAGSDGAKVFQKACVRCHKPPDPRDRTPQSWETIMMHMRVRGGLAADEAEAVLAFLKDQAQAAVPVKDERKATRAGGRSPASASQPGSAGKPATEVSAAGSVAAGRQLYEQLKCPSCHAIGGNGGHVGPPHDDVGRKLTRDDLRAKVKAGAKVMPPLPSEITDEQLNQLLDYLQTLRGQ